MCSWIGRENKKFAKPRDEGIVINKSHWKENMTSFGLWDVLETFLKTFCGINLKSLFLGLWTLEALECFSLWIV